MAFLISQSFATSSETQVSRANLLTAIPSKNLLGHTRFLKVFFPFCVQRNDWRPIPMPKPFLRRRSFHLAFAKYSAYRSRKVVTLSDQDLYYASCCTASHCFSSSRVECVSRGKIIFAFVFYTMQILNVLFKVTQASYIQR